MSELKGPGYFEIKQFINNKQLLDFQLITETVLRGTIIWYDNNSFHLLLDDGREVTLMGSYIVYYTKVRGGS